MASSWGCSLNPPLEIAEVAPRGLPADAMVELEDVPFHPQLAHHCGPASLLSQLEASGVATDYDTLVEKVYVPRLEGSLQVEIRAAARSFERIAYELPGEPRAVLAEVAAGRPVLVLLNLRTPGSPVWHYGLVIGFDAERNEVVLHSGREPKSRQKARAWLRRWDWAGRWALVLLRPGEWPAAPERARWLGALAAFEATAPPGAAERAWAVTADRWPDEPIAWLGLGNARFAAGEPAAAAEAFSRALELDPVHLPSRLNLAQALAEQGRPCAARRQIGPPPDGDHPLATIHSRLEERLESECPSP